MLQEFVPGGLPFLDAVILRNSPQSLVAEKAGSWQSISVTKHEYLFLSSLFHSFSGQFPPTQLNNPDSMVFQPHSRSSSDRRSLGHKISRKMPS